MTDVVVIGGGLNGLVAATWLAKQKFSVVLLERHDVVGGAAITGTSARGFKHSRLSHATGPISADVVRAIGLDRAQVQWVSPDPALTTIPSSGAAVSFHRDHVLTAASIERVSPRDAAQWQPFVHAMQRLASVLTEVNRHPAPSIDAPAAADVWRLLQLGRRARSLGGRDLARLGRYVPIAVADLVSEWFEHDLVQAAVASRAVFGHPVGPWSAGTGTLLLQRMAEDPVPVGSGVTVKGGLGALTAALAGLASAAGVDVRTSARVDRILSKGGVATGVVLESGDEIAAHSVVAAVSPRLALETLTDPADLPPTFRKRVHQIRARGVTAKVNLSLAAAPVFPALLGDELPLRGRILIAPSIDYLERAHDVAKYGAMPAEPWLEVSLPSTNDDSLAPAGQHVASIYAHNVPASSDVTADAVYSRVMEVLDARAPGTSTQVLEHETLTPADLERDWGLAGGHIFHGEGALDQWWISRPLLGWAHGYATPIHGLFLASAGTHPGGGLTGQSGLNAARVIAKTLRARRRK